MERWVPTIGVFSGVVVHDGKGRSSSFVDNGVPLRPAANGDDTLVTPLVGGEIELMTPGLTSLPGRPRFFVRGGVSATFGPDKDLAKEGNPGPLVDPGVIPPQVSAFGGQGSSTNAEVQSPLISAGAGAAFSFDLWGRRLRLKTSLEYLREEVEVIGIVNRVTLLGGTTFLEFKGKKTETFHGIGPGVEAEIDAMRAGPLMSSVFVSARIYRFLGNRDVNINDRDQITTVSPPIGVSASWKYEQDPWAYRAHVGFRLRWQPE